MLVSLLVVSVACNRGEEEAAATTNPTSVPADASLNPPGSATDSGVQSSTTIASGPTTTGSIPLAVQPVPFEIAWQETADDGLVSLVVTVADQAYTFDEMENLMRDVVDDFPTVISVRVVSDPAAVEPAVRYDTAQARAEDTAVLDEHFLVELVDGIRLIFRGPYEPMGQASLGS